MAERDRPKLNIFTKTETTAPAGQPVNLDDLDGRIMQTGVGLTAGEMEALDHMGKELAGVDPNDEEAEGVSRNSLIRWAVRLLIHEYRAGHIDLAAYVETPPPPKKRMRMLGAKSKR